MPSPQPEPTGAPGDAPEANSLFGRRVGALFLDWMLASAISAGFFQYHPLATLAIFAVTTLILLCTLGATIGHRVFGLRIYRMDTGTSPVAPLQALIRTACLLLLLPAAIASTDGRGLHDVWAGTFIDRFGARATPPRPGA